MISFRPYHKERRREVERVDWREGHGRSTGGLRWEEAPELPLVPTVRHTVPPGVTRPLENMLPGLRELHTHSRGSTSLPHRSRVKLSPGDVY